MEKIISYVLTAVHYLLFFLCLLIFHPIQLFCYHVIGYNAHRKSVVVLNWFLMQTQLPLFNTFSFKYEEPLETGKSYIFVCNHQSMFDIPPLIYYLSEHHPKFIAKKELAKGIPSISLNLRIGENCSIDRKDRKQSITALISFAKNVQEKNRSAVIFAEGTRSRTGIPKPFQRNGLKTLIKYVPDAMVVPVSINNSWKVDKYGKYPYGMGNRITVTAHKPISLTYGTVDEVIDLTEKVVHSNVMTSHS